MAPHPHLLERRARPVAIKVLVLALCTLALTFVSANLSPSQAVEYHTTCVGHGWVAGGSPSDGSFFSRVETGCGSGSRDCDIYNWGSYKGGLSTTTTTCNAWSNSYGSYTECASYAKVYFPGQFSQHNHTPDDYCAGLRAAPLGRQAPIGEEPLAESPDVEPAGAAVIGATALDPDGGPDFAVRVYRSQTGWTCPAAGRVQNGHYGTVWPGEGFHELEIAPDGACADLDQQPVGFAVSHHAAAEDLTETTTIYGAVAKNVSAVSITIDGQEQALELVSGTFILPTTIAAIARGSDLTVTTTSGQTLTYDVPIPSEQ